MSQESDIRQTAEQVSSVSDSLSPAQTARRNELVLDALMHQYFVQTQGGMLHPARIPVNTFERVLDVGCGVGEWIFDLARSYPKLHIYGMDINEETLDRAKVRRNVSGLHQIELRQMDITQPLPIPDSYLDFVHMRRCARFIPPALWPTVLQECKRVLRPGGWVTVVEAELWEISSPAVMAVQRAMNMARARLGRSMDATGTSIGIPARLYRMLLQTDFEEANYDLYTFDAGFRGGTTMRLFLSEIIRHSFLVKPMIVQQGLMSATEFDEIIEQSDKELQALDLCGWGILISAYGRRGE